MRLGSLCRSSSRSSSKKGSSIPTKLSRRVDEAAARLGAERKSVVPEVRTQGDESDKCWQQNAELDCEARFPLCHGACSTEDVQEGIAEWDLAHAQGQRRPLPAPGTQSCFCGICQSPPKPRRAFSCKGDVRIWKDFDARIPNEKGTRAPLEHSSSRRPMLIDLQATIPIRFKK
jgi:hypothetical protein